MTELSPGTSPPPVRMPMRRSRAMVSRRCRRMRKAGIVARWAVCIIGSVNYELFMGEALAEARLALSRGRRPVAAVTVVDEAMVSRGHDRVADTNDPTAHAVVVALRDAGRRMGRARL